jgi:hypothetical protein
VQAKYLLICAERFGILRMYRRRHFYLVLVSQN